MGKEKQMKKNPSKSITETMNSDSAKGAVIGHTQDTEIKSAIIMHRVTVQERMGDHYENQILCEFVVAVCRNNIFEVDNSKSRG